MPDCGERLAVENERRLETASCRDPPPINYGAQMLERSLPPQQQQQQQSGGRKLTGGIMSRDNYKAFSVEIRVPKWTDCNKLWINSEDFETAQFNADAARYLTGRLPVHFPDANFNYLPLRLRTGEELTTREKCSAYVAKIAKGPALLERRKDFKERAQKLILEMVKIPEVVRFLNTVRASPRQAWQPRPEANPEDIGSPFTEGQNGTAMEDDVLSEEALASTVTVDASQCDSHVPVSEETVIADDGGEENETPMEVDHLSVEAMTSYCMDVDMSTPFIPSFDMDLHKPENALTSGGQSIGIWQSRSCDKDEDLVPGNLRGFLASLDKGEEEVWKSTKPSDWEPWSPLPPFVPYSLPWATTGCGWQSRGATSGADATTLCDHLPGQFSVRTDAGLETFRWRFDALCEHNSCPRSA